MKASSIEHIALGNPDTELKDARAELAQKAASELGYKRLLDTLHPSGTLFSTLASLGIEPLRSEQVDAYKESKRRLGMYSGTKIGFVLLASLFAMVGPLVGVESTMGSRLSPFQLIGRVTAIVFAVTLLIANIVWALAEKWGHGTRVKFYWNRMALRHFTGPVPEYVLDKALRIHEKSPKAEFFIDQLFRERETQRDERKFAYLRDPFLFVSNSDEGFYIDVWDEKEYERHVQ